MTKPADATSPLQQPTSPKPATEELDDKDLERVTGGTAGITFPQGDGGAKDAAVPAYTVKL